MNKTLIGIALAALLCLLVGPFATGLVAEDRLEERIAAMDANNPWLEAEIGSYERGWFSSEAVVELRLALGDGAEIFDLASAGPVLALLTRPVPVRVELAHGPVILSDVPHFALTEVVARPDVTDADIRAATESLGVPYLFEFRGRSGFGGGFDFDGDAPAVSQASGLGEMEFSGLTIDGFADRAGLTLDGHTDRISFQSPFVAIRLDMLAFQTTWEFRPDRLPVSRSSMSIDGLVASSPLLGAAPLFELAGLATRQEFDVEEGGATVGGTVHWSSDLIAASDGPRIEDIDIGLAVAGIDAAAVSAYYETVDQAFAASLDDPDQLLAELEPIGESIVRRGFAVTLAPADFSTERGRFAATADIRVDGSGLPPAASTDLRDIAVLFAVLRLDADVTVAKPLAVQLASIGMREQLEAAGARGGEPFSPDELDAAAEAQAGLMLTSLAGQGLLVDAGDEYTSSIRFADGEFTINGAPPPFGLIP